jgi:hypothetical protein
LPETYRRHRFNHGMRIFAAALAAAAVATAPLHVALSAPGGHSPRVLKDWRYSVRATVNGKLVRGRITVQIADPLGGRHYVQFGRTNRYIRNFPFTGVFRDFIDFPRSSRGIPLTVVFTVRAAGTKKIVRYSVVPRA